MKYANVKISWTKSDSVDDIAKQVLSISVGGKVTNLDLPPDTQETTIQIGANQAMNISIKTFSKKYPSCFTESPAAPLVTDALNLPNPASAPVVEIIQIIDKPDGV
jgi:hypothetical protein